VVRAPAASPARYARRPLYLVLADFRAIAIFALRPLSLVLADDRVIAIFALRPPSVVLAVGRAIAIFALRPPIRAMNAPAGPLFVFSLYLALSLFLVDLSLSCSPPPRAGLGTASDDTPK